MPASRNAKPVVSVVPPAAIMVPGGFRSFHLTVDGERQTWADWKVDDPDAGYVKEGTFHALPGLRTSRVKLTGTTLDGKHSANAYISFQVGPAPGDGPAFVDDWSIHGLGRSVEWNDSWGRRAGRLILDTLMQLPPDFLRAVGPVRLVRMTEMDIQGKSPHGMHLPFLRRAVLLFDKDFILNLPINDVKFGTGQGDADYHFVRTFIHELAHVVLANRTIPDVDRWAVLGGLHTVVLATQAAPLHAAGLVPLALLGGYTYVKYYSAVAVHDFASDYAAVTGWVINNQNPLGMFWNENTALPNAVTGLIWLSLWTNLRNPAAQATPPTTLDPDTHYQQFGFASEYATVDVHEDFAEAVAAIAMGEPIASEPQFQARRKFIHDHGIWPRTWAPIRPGAELDAWALKAGKANPPDARYWAVHFGPWAGRPRDPEQGGKLVVTQVAPPAASGPASPAAPGVRALSTAEGGRDAAEQPGAGPKADVDAWLGVGAAMSHPWGRQETEEAVTSALGLVRLAETDRAWHHRAGPALGTVRTELERLSVPLDEASRLGLLRAAERHGTGLRLLGPGGTAASVDDRGVLRLAGVAARVGDLLFSEDGGLLVVMEVDDAGGIARLGAEAEETRAGTFRAPSAKAEDLRFHWRPDHTPRTWDEAPERAPALLRLIGLWGRGEGARGADLTAAGGLAAEALTAYGIRHRGLIDADAGAVAEYLGRLGAGVEALSKTGAAVAAGDLVRARRGGLWGVCTRGTPPGGGRVDVLWQGGVKPRAGEDEGTVTLHHGVDVATLGYRWSPGGQAKPGA